MNYLPFNYPEWKLLRFHTTNDDNPIPLVLKVDSIAFIDIDRYEEFGGNSNLLTLGDMLGYLGYCLCGRELGDLIYFCEKTDTTFRKLYLMYNVNTQEFRSLSGIDEKLTPYAFEELLAYFPEFELSREIDCDEASEDIKNCFLTQIEEYDL